MKAFTVKYLFAARAKFEDFQMALCYERLVCAVLCDCRRCTEAGDARSPLYSLNMQFNVRVANKSAHPSVGSTRRKGMVLYHVCRVELN